ncbi:TerB family tellurite resistance protein [Alginatibacterium sediminis]|uniref:TerB family tellurite resistance protein n=1 Tax=Alginatibacterium sediminis TaxID=2164068 RepID=A0A420EHM6_9ALTE|nr:TerB family tellurite resistance protein [Alginatibacterium sediminis]RKF20157.1 TerB family tellurite resistance protein [Alginatibacterium sediminis]
MLKNFKKLLESAFEQPTAVVDNSNKQQLSATSLLLQIALSDNQLADDEKRKTLERIVHLFELNAEESHELFEQALRKAEASTSVYEFTKDLKELDYQFRYQLVEDLWLVANADAVIDPHEEALIRQIADLLYVTQSDYIRAKQCALQQ